MLAEIAKRLFEHAKELYAAGEVAEALSIFEAVDKAYPNQPGLVHAREQCLRRLGRHEEAAALSTWLVAHAGAQAPSPAANLLGAGELQELLRPIEPLPEAPASAPNGMPSLQIPDLGIVGMPRVTPIRPAPPPPSRDWLRYAVAGAVTLAVIAGGTALTSRASKTEASAPAAQAPVPVPTPPPAVEAEKEEPPEAAPEKPAALMEPLPLPPSGPVRIRPQSYYATVGGQPIVLSRSNFDRFVAEGVSLVDFWAAWCPACRQMAPVVNQIAVEYQGRAKVGMVNVDNEPALSRRLGVTSYPTFLVVRDGQVVARFSGGKPKAEFDKLLNEALQ